MALCTDAVLRDGDLLGDPTEGALVVLAENGGVDVARLRRERPRVLEIPFDSDYKFMATFHFWRDDRGRDVVRCFVKGAPDVLAMSLGVDPVSSDAMSRPPRRPLERIVTRPRLLRILLAGGVMAAGTIPVLVLAPGPEPQLGVATVAGTMAFVTFVFFQAFNLLNVRHDTRSVFSRETLEILPPSWPPASSSCSSSSSWKWTSSTTSSPRPT